MSEEKDVELSMKVVGNYIPKILKEIQAAEKAEKEEKHANQ